MKQFYARGKQCYTYHPLIILYYRDIFKKWKSFAVDASNHILECFFFVVEISLEAMNTQYIFFEKSIAVKAPGRFCSGLQIEVIRVSFQKRFFKIAKLILHFLSVIHCNQHTHHIRTDCDTQNSSQYIYATYVSVDGNKGINFLCLSLR